jgi:hypothetical protein
MITSRKPKMPKLSSVRSKPSPNTSRARGARTSGIRFVLINDSARAPTTTPQMLPRPPRMTIASTKIENENSNWSALTVF